MGFFLAGFVRDPAPTADLDAEFLRDERGHLVRDLLGMPVRIAPGESVEHVETVPMFDEKTEEDVPIEDEEWEGFEDDEPVTETDKRKVESGASTESGVHVYRKPKVPPTNKHSYNIIKKRPDLIAKDKKRRKGRK